MNDKIMFFVINEEGIREDAQILAKYKLSNGNNYITYTYNEINDNNMIKIYSTGVIKENDGYSYKEIVTNEEWDEIKAIMKEIARDTINWVEDEEWGYEVPVQVNGIDIEKYNPRNYYTEEEYKVLASRLKAERKAWLAKYELAQSTRSESK